MKKDRRGYIVFAFISAACIFFTLTGYRLSIEGNIEWSLWYTLRTVGISLAAGAAMGWLIVRLLQKHGTAAKTEEAWKKSRWDVLLSLPVSWGLMLLLWLPCFLAYFPAICAYDITVQMGQCGDGAWNDHHPFIHTWVLNAFWRFGRDILGNANMGIALLALLQMVLLSGAFALSIYLLKKRKCSKKILYLLLAFGCLYPFHMFMSISITKDTLFSPFFVMLVVLCCCILIDGKNTLRFGWQELALFFCILPVIWFRNNARYAVMLFVCVLGLMSIFGRRKRRLHVRLFLVNAAGCLVGLLVLSVAFRAANVTQGDRREMLSMPIQQLARTMYYHEEEIEPETRAFLGNVMLNESWKQYEPAIADPVKRNVYTGYIKDHFGEFIKIYMDLFLRYPGDFINAAMAVDAGYLYPFDTSCTTVNENGIDSGLGYVQTRWEGWIETFLQEYGITKASLLPGYKAFLERMVDTNAFVKWPVINLILLPGWQLWAYLYLAAVTWYRKQYKLLAPFAFLGGYFGTLLLGPVVQLRYIYPMTICLPFVVALVWLDWKKIQYGEREEELGA